MVFLLSFTHKYIVVKKSGYFRQAYYINNPDNVLRDTIL